MIRKLRRQFVCATMAIAALTLLIILSSVIHSTGVDLEKQSMSAMRAIASAPHGRDDLKKPKADVRVPYFTVDIGETGDVIGMGGGYFDLTDREDVRQLAEAVQASNKESGILWKYGLRFLKHKPPRGELIVFADITAEVATMWNLLRNCTLVFLGAMAGFLGISIWLSRWFVRPVEEAWERQRQFVADASHELKTPLSVIMANAELMRSEETTPEDRDTCSGNILSTSYQMRSLVENMLDMARMDDAGQKMQFEEVDFSQLVRDAVLSVQLLYEEKTLGLQCDIREGICVQGSEQHLFQIMDVLLDNALKYSSLPGTVSVTLSRSGKHCLLGVFSPGEPIPREERELIFKRFYRGDKARTMNGSYGLGLSIAKAVAEAHKGKIWVESGDGGNTFRVQLPMRHIK
ncbi:MAG: HAMP domain-containing histidine kinase [Ruminococcaceae bacterium]|nr:HAMP domain-containing histidine kinase [Oscillospiraceae bacterium]